MFKENWLKIWELAMLKDVPVDEGLDMFRAAVAYDMDIKGFDFDFSALHEEYKKLSSKQQNKVYNEARQYILGSYWVLVKKFNEYLRSKGIVD